MKSKRKALSRERILYRKLLRLWKRGQSPYCEVRGSAIHGHGVFAACFIPKKKRIIEYIGERIDKKESQRRCVSQHAKSLKSGDASVYVFILSKKFDIDGNLPWNTARLINHSCVPNCEAWIEGRRIFIYPQRDIEAGEELTFDYGFEVNCYKDHPCRCGHPECVRHIVSREQWPKLLKRLKKKSCKSASNDAITSECHPAVGSDACQPGPAGHSPIRAPGEWVAMPASMMTRDEVPNWKGESD